MAYSVYKQRSLCSIKLSPNLMRQLPYFLVTSEEGDSKMVKWLLHIAPVGKCHGWDVSSDIHTQSPMVFATKIEAASHLPQVSWTLMYPGARQATWKAKGTTHIVRVLSGYGGDWGSENRMAHRKGLPQFSSGRILTHRNEVQVATWHDFSRDVRKPNLYVNCSIFKS